MKEFVFGIHKPRGKVFTGDLRSYCLPRKVVTAPQPSILSVAEPGASAYAVRPGVEQCGQLGNVLLMGTSDFLGAQVLSELIRITDCDVYCLMNESSESAAKEQLRQSLISYFGDGLTRLIGERIHAVAGNTIFTNLGLEKEELLELMREIDTVFYAVKPDRFCFEHSEISCADVESAKNIIKLCMDHDKKLHYTSSLEIAGLDDIGDSIGRAFREDYSCFVSSRDSFIATFKEVEKIITDEMQNGRLMATVYRLGNITERYSDGHFQKNISHSLFHNILRAFVDLSLVHSSMLCPSFEFTPVDCCSNALIKLADRKSSQNKIFHIFNPNFVEITEFVEHLKHIGIMIEVMNDCSTIGQYVSYISNNKKSRQKDAYLVAKYVDALSMEIDSLYTRDIAHDITDTHLNETQFKWPHINLSYFQRMIKHWIDVDYLYGG